MRLRREAYPMLGYDYKQTPKKCDLEDHGLCPIHDDERINGKIEDQDVLLP